jgi:hypothetical protein
MEEDELDAEREKAGVVDWALERVSAAIGFLVLSFFRGTGAFLSFEANVDGGRLAVDRTSTDKALFDGGPSELGFLTDILMGSLLILSFVRGLMGWCLSVDFFLSVLLGFVDFAVPDDDADGDGDEADGNTAGLGLERRESASGCMVCESFMSWA